MRPAVCLTEPIGPHEHVVLAFLTSRIAAEPLASDILIEEHLSEFEETGLHKSSTLQLHRLLTISTALIRRHLGTLGPSLQSEIKKRLGGLFGLSGN